MTQYKCNNSFTSSAGKKYFYAEEISSYTYDGLLSNEKQNFYRVEESNYISSPSITDDISSIYIAGIDSYDDSSGNSMGSSDFSGFDGGDFGGGGAGGDW